MGIGDVVPAVTTLIVETPRKTNVLRPFYRLGWLAIWGGWFFTLMMVVPSPKSGTFGWKHDRKVIKVDGTHRARVVPALGRRLGRHFHLTLFSAISKS